MAHSPLTHAVLERMRLDAAHEPLPKLDVAGVERRILAEVARSQHSSVFVPVRHTPWPLWLAIGAATGLSFFAATQPWQSTPSVSRSLPARGSLVADEGLDGSKLAINQLIIATDKDVTVKHRDHVTWRLLAHGQARVVENDQHRVTIDLDLGLIQADVMPRPTPESFAIEVGQTRVAVHGTVFSVERRGTAAEVIVREGKVMLGHIAARGATEGTLLTAPSRARLEVADDHPELSQPPSNETQQESSRDRAPSIPTNTGGAQQGKAQNQTLAAERPSSLELERAWNAATRIVSDCFAAHTERSPSVRVSFNTQLTLTVSDRGTIADVAFAPPVPETVRQCTMERVGAITTSPSRRGAVLTRPTQLTR